MKAIKWTVAERKAIRMSRDHWKRDIVKPLEAGDELNNKGFLLRWVGTDRPLKTGTDDCALCRMCYCSNCPLERFYNEVCSQPDSRYQKFLRRGSLRTAKAMMNALDRMLKREPKT